MEFVQPVFELFCSCFGQEFNHAVDLDQNVRSLIQEMAELREIRDGVKQRVDFSERLRLVRTDAVERWLVDVENLDETVSDIEAKFQKGAAAAAAASGRRCSPGRWWASYCLSRNVVEKLSELRYLKRTGEFDVVAE